MIVSQKYEALQKRSLAERKGKNLRRDLNFCEWDLTVIDLLVNHTIYQKMKVVLWSYIRKIAIWYRTLTSSKNITTIKSFCQHWRNVLHNLWRPTKQNFFLGTNKVKTLHRGAKDVFEKIVFRSLFYFILLLLFFCNIKKNILPFFKTCSFDCFSVNPWVVFIPHKYSPSSAFERLSMVSTILTGPLSRPLLDIMVLADWLT